MDFKSAIIKGIQAIQETAGSEEIRKEWEALIEIARAEEDDAKLALMYQTFIEEMKKTAGDKVEPFKAKVPSGEVRTFTSVEQYLKEIRRGS